MHHLTNIGPEEEDTDEEKVWGLKYRDISEEEWGRLDDEFCTLVDHVMEEMVSNQKKCPGEVYNSMTATIVSLLGGKKKSVTQNGEKNP